MQNLAAALSTILIIGSQWAWAEAQEHSYTLQFELEAVDVSFAEKIRAIDKASQDAFKTELASLAISKGFSDGAVDLASINVKRISYIKLGAGSELKNLQVEFTLKSSPSWAPQKPAMGDQPSSKPVFDPEAFSAAMDASFGAVVTAGTAKLPTPPGFSSLGHPLPDAEDEEDFIWAKTTPAPAEENQQSKQMAEFFSIFGLVFIVVLLFAGWALDMKSQKKNAP